MFRIIALVGHSGCGKSEIQKISKKLHCHVPLGLTTRKPRKGEEGYSYLTANEFLLEHSKGKIFGETIYNGNLYGTHESDIEPNRINVFPVTLEGLEKLRQRFNNKYIVSIFIDSTKEQRRERMLARGDSEEKIRERINADEKRLKNAFHLTDYKITSGTKEEDTLEFIDILREIKEDAYIF